MHPRSSIATGAHRVPGNTATGARFLTAKAVFITLLFACCATSSALRAMSGEEAGAELEQQSREEIRAAQKRGDTYVPESSLRGKLYAYPEATRENPEVMGVFVVKGRAYQLKTANGHLREELSKRMGQEICLEGEIRNHGKYFMARRVTASLPPAVVLRDRKGL